MDQILQGIPFCHCILDDILVTGRSDQKYFHILEQVFAALHENGLQLNTDKYSFMQDSLEYVDMSLQGMAYSKPRAIQKLF